MALIVVSILILCYLLIATERLTNINKAAVAVFAGTVSWVLYISYGTDFVMDMHRGGYINYLDGETPSSLTVKDYIWQEVFLPCIGNCSEVVLFLLATMTIVEILHNNGCFDFLTVWLRTQNSRVLLWKLAGFTFLLSANLDNISTTVMMLMVMNSILPRSKDRILYGSVVVLAANFGGALTVIGDPTSLMLWNMGAISATNYTLSMLLPCLVGVALPTYLLSRSLSETVYLDRPAMPYRGDDTNLKVWQRFIMFFVGIGGLWFIPTFHNITKLSPFLGAFCVLSVLWIVNELFNRSITNPDRRLMRSIPQQLQYGIIQLMLYVMGIMLAVAAVNETGAFSMLTSQITVCADNVWVFGAVSGIVSLVLDGFATAAMLVSMYSVVDPDSLVAGTSLALNDDVAPFVVDGLYWRMISYCTAFGGSIFALGSVAGVTYLQNQRVGVMWYFRKVGLKVLPAGIIGIVLLWLMA